MTTNITNTMTLEATNPLSRMDFDPSIPHFMEAQGYCSILVRNKGEAQWHEHWVETNAFISGAAGASDIEVESYLSLRDTDYPSEEIDLIDDTPEPISVHDADLWEACNEIDDTFDLNDHDFNAMRYERAVRYA